MTDPPPAPAVKPRRRGLGVALVLVASLLAFAALLAVWVNRQALNTDNWTAASSEMLEQPAVHNQLATYLVDQLYANVDVEARIREALPPRAEPLAGPAAGALRELLLRRARESLADPDTQQLWENANRAAHAALLRVLDGDEPAVVLDLKALLEETQQRAGLAGRLTQALPDDAAQITVLRSDQLDGVQTAGTVLKALPIVLVVLSLGLFGAALLVAPGWRRRAVRGYGVGLVAAGGGALLAVSVAGDAIVETLARTAATEPAIRDVWEISTTLLDEAATATIGYGLVLIAGAWLSGGSAWATGLRRSLAPYLRDPVLAYGALAVLAVVVLLWWAPTPATRNPVTAVVLLGMLALGFEGLRRQTAAEFPSAERGEAQRRAREGLAGLGRSARAQAGAAAARGSELTATAAREVRARSAGSEREPTAEDLRLERLERLVQLRADGILDDEELRAEKARILNGEEDAQPPAPLTP
jgi:hypothetical protein